MCCRLNVFLCKDIEGIIMCSLAQAEPRDCKQRSQTVFGRRRNEERGNGKHMLDCDVGPRL